MKGIKNGKDGFRDIKLSQKITLTFLATALLLCVVMAAALQVTFCIYDRHLYEKSQAELDFFAQQVNAKLAQIEELTVDIATGSEVQNHLSRMQEMEYLSPEYNYAKQQLMTILQTKIFSQDIIRNVVYTDQNQVTFTAGTYTGEMDLQERERLLQQFQERRGGYVSLSPSGDYPYLVSGRDILEVKNATLDYLGSLIFTSDIGAWIGRKADELEAEHSTLLVCSDRGVIYQEGDTKGLMPERLTGERGYQVISLQGERTFLCYERSRETGWMYVNVFPYSEIYGQVLVLR